MKKFHFISWIVLFLYCLIIFFIILGDKGLIAYYEIENKKEQLQKQIYQLHSSKKILEYRLKNLQEVGDYYEYEIKNKLLYLKNKDVIILFP